MVIPANKDSTFIRQPQYFNPLLLGPNTILNLAQKRQTLEKVIGVLKLLEPDDFIDYMLDFYETGLARYGDDWGYADQLTVLCAAASLLRVENYLEIGVFRGRSLALLASQSADTRLFGFDLWVENYAGLENPGPEYVRSQLARIGYQGDATLISGHSQETVPAFLEAHPDLYFDLVTVDGDHSYEGARVDLQNVLPRIKIGGVLVFDDIRNPHHYVLEYLWEEIVGANPSFLTAKYTGVGVGVALAVRCEADINPDKMLREVEERVQTLPGRQPAAEAAHVENEEEQRLIEQKLQKTGTSPAAMLKMVLKMDSLLNEAEADRAARLSVINDLEARLQESEADRSARLEAIRTLESLLQESEADRAARLEVIHNLEQSNRDFQQRLDWMPVRALLKARDRFTGGSSHP